MTTDDSLTRSMHPLPQLVCPLCGGANLCAPAGAGRLDIECWCSKTSVSRDALAQVPAHLLNKACLCPRCAAGLTPDDPVSVVNQPRRP